MFFDIYVNKGVWETILLKNLPAYDIINTTVYSSNLLKGCNKNGRTDFSSG